MGLVTECICVQVEGRPKLTHRRSAVSITGASLNIWRLSDPEAGAHYQLASAGPQFSFFFSEELALDCLGRMTSSFTFNGSCLGTMREDIETEAGERLTLIHPITEFSLLFSVEPAEHRFSVQLVGKMVPTGQDRDSGLSSLKLIKFAIKVMMPLAEVGALFQGKKAIIRSKIDRALARLSSAAQQGSFSVPAGSSPSASANKGITPRNLQSKQVSY